MSAAASLFWFRSCMITVYIKLGLHLGISIYHCDICRPGGVALRCTYPLCWVVCPCLFRLSSVSYLFGSLGAALRAVCGAVSGSRAPLWCLGVDVFGHVDIIVQQHLLLHPSGEATGGSRGGAGGVSVTQLWELLHAFPAASPVVGLRASA